MAGLPKTPKSVALIGNYLPRRCGIATFTHDLSEALALEFQDPATDVAAVVMNDREEGYCYSDRVKCTISANVEADYLRAAEFLNSAQYDAVILQHEFGIFGGECGSHIFHLLRNLRLPLITTLHTVLKKPSEIQKSITQQLAEHSEYLVVMSHKAELLLQEVYGIARQKIVFIPHGIPDVPFESAEVNKELFGFSGRKVILTFGLLSPNKGIEYAIEAMPEITKQHPDALYVLLGTTHPQIKKENGEAYRHQLQQLAKQLKVEDSVQFLDKFVDLNTLVQYLGAADIYLSPYTNREQIVSGTLAYSLGVGNAVVSTPYWYAQELLSENRGCLVDFENSKAIATTINHLISCDSEREAMRARAYEFTRDMVWKTVVTEYLGLISDLSSRKETEKVDIPVRVPEITTEERLIDELPEINLRHLLVLTDDTGILQHATFSVPNRGEGYCTDDNARALILCCKYYAQRKDETMLAAIHKYMAFLLNAFCHTEGRFRNFMSYDRKWLEDVGSEDSHGRALWGLGATIQYAPTKLIRCMALQLFDDALPAVRDFSSPRAWALGIIGLCYYREHDKKNQLPQEILTELSNRLYDAFEKNASNNWLWAEDILSYANAKLPEALMLAGNALSEPRMTKMGADALSWLIGQQTAPEGHLSIIGNSKWLLRGEKKAQFDQQPIEAMALVQACATAYHVTGAKHWLKEAERSFSWFLSNNDLKQEVYDSESGACFDGLQALGVNLNQGAESTLSFLLSLVEMYELASVRQTYNASKLSALSENTEINETNLVSLLQSQHCLSKKATRRSLEGKYTSTSYTQRRKYRKISEEVACEQKFRIDRILSTSELIKYSLIRSSAS